MRRTRNLTVYNEDARPWLRRSDGGYDVIIVDAYRQPYIPFYLATREFFELVRDRLAPGGVVIVNVGHPEDNDDLETVLGRTMADGLPDRAPRPDRGHEHAAGRQRRPGLGQAACAPRGEHSRPASSRTSPTIEAARIGPRLPGRRASTPTTARRSSG